MFRDNYKILFEILHECDVCCQPLKLAWNTIRHETKEEKLNNKKKTEADELIEETTAKV